MESYQSPSKFVVEKLVQFPSVPTRYPYGEKLVATFTLPSEYRPEVGDWIGIFPVGWSTLSQVWLKKMVRPEHLCSPIPFGQQRYGRIEFDTIEFSPKPFSSFSFTNGQQPQYYQFVYVKNGQYVHGMSTPFIVEDETAQVYPGSSNISFIGGGDYYPTIMDKLETGLQGFEIGSSVFEPSTYPSSVEIGSGNSYLKSIEIKKYWQTKTVETVKLMSEQLRVEQAGRHLDQLFLIEQLKSYERHILAVLKKEQEIKEYLRVKTIGKQLMTVDFERKLDLLHQLRKTIQKCELKLKELQTVEYQHYAKYTQSLKYQIAQFEAKYLSSFLMTVGEPEQTIPIGHDMQLREQFKQVVYKHVQEQVRDKYKFVKMQDQIVYMIQEIYAKLNNTIGMEWSDVYTQFNIPAVYAQFPYAESRTTGLFAKVKQYETKLNGLKYKLISKQQQQQQVNGPFGGIEFVQPVIKHVYDLDMYLREEKMPFLTQVSPIHHKWFNERVESLTKYKNFFETLQQQQQQFNGQFPIEHTQMKQLWSKLREFELELAQFPHFFKYQLTPTTGGGKYYPSKMLETVDYLKDLVGGKIQHLFSWYEQTPVEYFIHNEQQWAGWREMLSFEKILIELKSTVLGMEQYKQLSGRLSDIEEYVVINGRSWLSSISSTHLEQVKILRRILDQEEANVYYPTYGIIKSPEQFYFHQHMHAKLYKMINGLELAMIYKHKRMDSIYKLESEEWIHPTYFDKFPIYSFYFIHHQFERMVQELVGHSELPAHYLTKIQPIVSFLKQAYAQYAGDYKRFPMIGKEIVSKMVEFETLLGQPEMDKYFKWTPKFSAPTYNYNFYSQPQVFNKFSSQRDWLKQMIERTRFLTSQAKSILVKQSPTSTTQLYEQDLLNNNLFVDNVEQWSSPSTNFTMMPVYPPTYYKPEVLEVSVYGPFKATGVYGGSEFEFESMKEFEREMFGLSPLKSGVECPMCGGIGGRPEDEEEEQWLLLNGGKFGLPQFVGRRF